MKYKQPSSPEHAVRDEYGRLATEYDTHWSRYLHRSIVATLEAVRQHPARASLDVGCGTGLLLDALAADEDRDQDEACLAGVDLSLEMLEKADERLDGRVVLAQATAERLPFTDARFDRILSSSMFHYLPRPHEALAEWHRVLGPGGMLIIGDWCRDYLTMAGLDLFLRMFNAAHCRTWNAAELEAALSDAGFASVRIERRRLDAFWGYMVATATRA